ncbi:MAG: hypothetical protein ACRYF0_03970, partial [Janthinobacterium lividum]
IVLKQLRFHEREVIKEWVEKERKNAWRLPAKLGLLTAARRQRCPNPLWHDYRLLFYKFFMADC